MLLVSSIGRPKLNCEDTIVPGGDAPLLWISDEPDIGLAKTFGHVGLGGSNIGRSLDSGAVLVQALNFAG